jgi:hypothetical protein
MQKKFKIFIVLLATAGLSYVGQFAANAFGFDVMNISRQSTSEDNSGSKLVEKENVRTIGLILLPTHSLDDRLSFFPMQEIAPSLYGNPAVPDLDLHAITPDGRHIGMNYQTDKFENQIAGSITSEDKGGSEWIFVPSDERVRFYVSAHDNQAFFNENPKISKLIWSKTDKYELYARTFDINRVYTSATISRKIQPGNVDFYLITEQIPPFLQSNNINAISYLRAVRDYISAMKIENKETKTAYFSRLKEIENSLVKKQRLLTFSQIKTVEKETDRLIKKDLIGKTDGEELLSLFGRLNDLALIELIPFTVILFISAYLLYRFRRKFSEIWEKFKFPIEKLVKKNTNC